VATCLNCGFPNEEGAGYCRRCGATLGASPVPGPPAAPPSAATSVAWGSATTFGSPPLAGSEYQITHRGQLFGAGYGPGFYGVWDLRTGGAPVAWFERTDGGWGAAWRRFQELESAAGVPPWRRAKAGWIALHVLIGIGLWILLIVAVTIVATIAGRTTEDAADRSSAVFGGVGLLVLLSTVAAWILFVYLRKPTRTRTIVFLALFLAGFVAFLVAALASLPRGT
jgi:hypothetical protein